MKFTDTKINIDNTSKIPVESTGVIKGHTIPADIAAAFPDNALTISQIDGLEESLSNLPTTVLDVISRKTLATYDPNGPKIGQTRVFQSDLPGVLWTLIDTDVTLDASWIGQPYTVDPDGDVIVSMELADITGTVPDRNVLGVSGNQLRLGDGVTPDGVDVLPSAAKVMSLVGDGWIASLASVRGASNAGTCYFATTRATSGTFTVKTSTGYARLVNPDNTLGTQAGTGVAGNSITLTIPASSLHRAYGVISVTNGGTVRSGNITLLTINSRQLTSFSGTGLSALTDLNLSDNQLTSFSGTGLSALTSLALHGNNLTTFSATGLSSLTTLTLQYNQLTSFSGTGLSALTDLYLYNNQLTSFSATGLSSLTTLYLTNNQLTSFSGTGLSALTYLYINNNQLTTFSGTGLSSLTILYLQNNNLTSILATGLDLSSSYMGGSDIGDNDLSLGALQAFVDSLAVTTTGSILYGGNPGSTDFAAWLTPANDKDYIWSNT